MKEADYKTKMVKQIRAEGGWGRRVEDQYAVGYPDTNLIPEGGPVFFAEVKIIRSKNWGVTSRQLVELQRIAVGMPHAIPVMIGINLKGDMYVACRPELRAGEAISCCPIRKRPEWATPITSLLRAYQSVIQSGSSWERFGSSTKLLESAGPDPRRY